MLNFFSSVRTGAIVGTGGERNQALENKLLKLHEELTELHRKRGEVHLSSFLIQFSSISANFHSINKVRNKSENSLCLTNTLKTKATCPFQF